MRWKKVLNYALLTAVAGVLVTVLISCSSGPISYQEADELEGQIQELRARLEMVENKLADLQSAEGDDLSAAVSETVPASRDEINTVVARLSEIEETLKPPEPQEMEPAIPESGTGGIEGGDTTIY